MVGPPDITQARKRCDGGIQCLRAGRLQSCPHGDKRFFAGLFKQPEDISL